MLTLSTSPGIQAAVYTSFADCSISPDDWDHYVEQRGGPVYFTYDWMRLWWQFYGRGRELRIFALTCDDQTVGILPIFIETFRLGVLNVRVARLVGSGTPARVLNPPVFPQHSDAVFRHVIRLLLTTEKVDLISLGLISEDWSAKDLLASPAEGQAGPRYKSNWTPSDVLTLFTLPSTFDEYVQALPKKERQTRKEKVRQLIRHAEVSMDIVDDRHQLAGEFERFLEQHTAQWRAEGFGGHFVAWPSGVEFHRALVSSPRTGPRALFVRLNAGGVPIANRYVYRMGNRLFSELPSRVVGPEWDRLGLGTTSYFKFIEAAIGNGITEINSGLGQYEYKVRLGGRQIPAGVWRIVSDESGAQFRARTLLRLSRLVKLAFHKIYYRRIVPQLPRQFSRTQQMFWLRYDV